MTIKFIVLGSTDEVTTCDCCGKSGLKVTWGVQMVDTGDVLHYGSTCVTRNTGKTPKQMQSEIEASRTAKIQVARAEYHAHPAYIAADAKMEEGHRLGILPGITFRNFCRAATGEADQVRRVIAEKHGVEVWTV
jgi:hypothetical protein